MQSIPIVLPVDAGRKEDQHDEMKEKDGRHDDGGRGKGLEQTGQRLGQPNAIRTLTGRSLVRVSLDGRIAD